MQFPLGPALFAEILQVQQQVLRIAIDITQGHQALSDFERVAIRAQVAKLRGHGVLAMQQQGLLSRRVFRSCVGWMDETLNRLALQPFGRQVQHATQCRIHFLPSAIQRNDRHPATGSRHCDPEPGVIGVKSVGHWRGFFYWRAGEREAQL
ncbi:MAG: hypothetical protein V4704_11150 [Pseudomonadota bacterium]